MKRKIPTIVLFGNTGSGKSCLSNTLTGNPNNFKESPDVESETMETIGKPGKFNSQETFIIDTPGMHDAHGLDTPHLTAMTQYIKDHKDVQAFVIVISVVNVRLDDCVKKLFQLVANMYPEKKWYQHLAVAWSNYSSDLPQRFKDQKTKREGFKRFFKEHVLNTISENELNNIPQYFVDSIEARTENDPSNRELSHLIAWVGQLETLYQNLGEIKKDVNANFKKIEPVEETRIVNVETKLRDKKTTKAKFIRNKYTDYHDKISYDDWKEVPNSRFDEHELLPLAPLGEPKKETRPQKVPIGSPYQEEYNDVRVIDKRIFGVVARLHHEVYYHLKQRYREYDEERTLTPMNDGTTKISDWVEIKGTSKETVSIISSGKFNR